MFRSSRAVFKRFRGDTPLTSKQGNKTFYKGRGAPAAGRRLTRGRWIPQPRRVFNETFEAPDLNGFKLKPYVDATTPEI